MPPKQVVAPGAIQLADGGLLPMSTYNSELTRLLSEALSAPQPRPKDKWIQHRIARDIPNMYGHTCHRCNKRITMHWNGQPCKRKLMTEDQYQHGLTTHGFFHTDCWRIYQKEKKKQRRQMRNRWLQEPSTEEGESDAETQSDEPAQHSVGVDNRQK